ncbi:MAG TPA: tetratricopeptide repeat protein [Phycisphaerae bacterium]|nr:tetratricopeptide repeat protein [Phycisphaerae bacterium]
MEESLPRPSPASRPPLRVLPAAAILVASGILAYCNTFHVPFIFDDHDAIRHNVFIRRLWPLSYSLHAAPDTTVSGRPIVNFSLAVNYALHGLRLPGYHIFNLVIHLLAGLLLFGILRRTLLASRRTIAFADSSTGLALVAALIWIVHPLQTESVTYIIQRAESLCGLFYLLTLYAALRGMAGGSAFCWYSASVIASALGMATKEVMATAPLALLAFDRIFFAESFKEQFRRRGPFYLALFSTWIIVAWLNIGGPRASSAGFSVESSTPLSYALTQFGVILHYLRLTLLPYPLCLDYGWPLAKDPLAIIGPGIVITLLVAATVWALRRRPAWGFCGLWFFLILGPTSSIIPIEDRAFDHRMYLPLAAICVLAVVGIHRLVQRASASGRISNAGTRALSVGLPTVVAIVLMGLTLRRNYDYRTEISIWEDVIAKRPDSPRPYDALGTAYLRLDRLDEAEALYRQNLQRWPDHGDSHHNLASVLAKRGDYVGAEASFRESIRLAPAHPGAHFNLGLVLGELGKHQEALFEYGEAIRLDPAYPEAHNAAGKLLARLGQPDKAVEQYREAIYYKPEWPRVHNNLGNVLAKLGRLDEAAEHYQEALRLQPGWAEVHSNLGITLARQGRLDDAIIQFRTAIQLKPAETSPYYNLAQALMKQGKIEEALEQCRQLARARPGDADPLFHLGQLLMQAGRREEAEEQFQAARKINPQHRGAAARLHELAARNTPPVSTTQSSK